MLARLDFDSVLIFERVCNELRIHVVSFCMILFVWFGFICFWPKIENLEGLKLPFAESNASCRCEFI